MSNAIQVGADHEDGDHERDERSREEPVARDAVRAKRGTAD
jgi:hypothetical protein